MFTCRFISCRGASDLCSIESDNPRSYGIIVNGALSSFVSNLTLIFLLFYFQLAINIWFLISAVLLVSSSINGLNKIFDILLIAYFHDSCF